MNETRTNHRVYSDFSKIRENIETTTVIKVTICDLLWKFYFKKFNDFFVKYMNETLLFSLYTNHLIFKDYDMDKDITISCVILQTLAANITIVNSHRESYYARS